jgi:hypothetical protein
MSRFGPINHLTIAQLSMASLNIFRLMMEMANISLD